MAPTGPLGPSDVERAEFVLEDARARAHRIIEESVAQAQQLLGRGSGDPSLDLIHRSITALNDELRDLRGRLDRIEGLLRAPAAYAPPAPPAPPAYAPPAPAPPPPLPDPRTMPAAPPAGPPVESPRAEPRRVEPPPVAPPRPLTVVPPDLDAPPQREAVGQGTPAPAAVPPRRPVEPPPVPRPPRQEAPPPAPPAPAPEMPREPTRAPDPLAGANDGGGSGAPDYTAASQPPPAAFGGPAVSGAPAASGEIQFSPEAGSITLRVSPVSGFQGLMRVQDALAHITAVREATVEAYSQGEARLRLQLREPITTMDIAAGLSGRLGQRAHVESSSAAERTVRVALG